MQPDVRRALDDARRAGILIQEVLRDHAFAEFQSDWVLQSAVERQYIVIGEALARVRQKEPDVLAMIDRAEAIIGLRNILVHGYDSADPERVYALSLAPLDRFIQDLALLLA